MVEICEYNVRGYYLHRGFKGIQEGEISYFSDEKLIGLISDIDEKPFFERLILGVYLPKESSLAFLKLSPFRYKLPPILYSLTSEKLTNDITPSGTYLGFWIGVGNVPLIENLEEILHQDKIEINYELEELPAELLIDTYFEQRALKEMESISQRWGFRGGLTFLKKENP